MTSFPDDLETLQTGQVFSISFSMVPDPLQVAHLFFPVGLEPPTIILVDPNPRHVGHLFFRFWTIFPFPLHLEQVEFDTN